MSIAYYVRIENVTLVLHICNICIQYSLKLRSNNVHKKKYHYNENSNLICIHITSCGQSHFILTMLDAPRLVSSYDMGSSTRYDTVCKNQVYRAGYFFCSMLLTKLNQNSLQDSSLNTPWKLLLRCRVSTFPLKYLGPLCVLLSLYVC